MVGLSVSPDNTKIAFGLDTVGRRQYEIRVKDLNTGKILDDIILNTTGSVAWANDNTTFFYTKKDEKTLRADSIYKHKLGTDQVDHCVFVEKDDTFGATVYKSKSRDYIIIACYSSVSNEYHILNADTPEADFDCFQKRIRDVEYSISHYKDYFYIVTNVDGSFNFKLMKTPVSKTGIENWQEVIAHREDTLLEDIDIFKDYLVISERTNGLNQIKVINWSNDSFYYLPFDSETYMVNTTSNVDFDTELLRYSYSSLTTPNSTFDFNMCTKEKVLLKQQEIVGGYNESEYQSERIWATAQDGTQIPISMVYKKGINKDGNNPMLLYAYGSYGITVDPYFSSLRLSLLDRGFIYAIAHIRGGEYLGRKWYEGGKLLEKKNTFTDFIDCSQFVIEQGYTSPHHLYAMGGSAGGLLIGAVINQAPQLYNGIVAAVPFVDVVNTMLDDTIPLTTGEYDEWGNPHEETYYHYIKSYSPYDQVKAQDYPNMLVITGYHDSQVQYWEPAKWVAKLREFKTNNNKLYLKTNMEAGHGGASGRFEALKEDAEEYAFLLELENITR
jgi:oligopeptidase B